MSTDSNRRAGMVQRFPTFGHYVLFARICVFSLLHRPLVRFLSLPALMRLLTPKRPPAPVDAAAMEEAKRIDLYIRYLLRLNPDDLGRRCLKRSLLLYRFLRVRGIPARFCLGVRRRDDQLEGHAWIEVEGRNFSDPGPVEGYAVTFSHPDGLK
jgi:hypothetical protein